MTNEDLLNIAQAFAYLQLKLEKVLPEGPDRKKAIELLEQAAAHITSSARAERHTYLKVVPK